MIKPFLRSLYLPSTKMATNLAEEFPRSGLVYLRALEDYLDEAESFGSVSAKALCKVIKGATANHNYQEHSVAMLKSMSEHHKMLETLAKEAGQPFDVIYLRTLFEEGIVQHARVDFSSAVTYGASLCKQLKIYPSFMAKFVPCTQDYVLDAFAAGKWDDQMVKKCFKGPNKAKLLIGLAQTNELVFGEFVENRVSRPELEALSNSIDCEPRLAEAVRVMADTNKPLDWKGKISASPLTPELAGEVLGQLQPDFLRLSKGREVVSGLLAKILEGDSAVKEKALEFALWNPHLKGLAKDLMDMGCPTSGYVKAFGSTSVSKLPVVDFMLDALVLGGTTNELGPYKGEVLETFEYAVEKGYIKESKNPGSTPLWKSFLCKVDLSMAGKGTNWDRKVAVVDKLSKFPSFEECVAFKESLPESLLVVLARRCPKSPITLKLDNRKVESDIPLI